MTTFDDNQIFQMLIVALVIATSPFLALRLREWITEISSARRRQRHKLIARMSILSVGLAVFFVGVPATPVFAKDLYVLSTNTGLEFYQADAALIQPNLTMNRHSEITLPFDQPKAAFIDPGFRTSVTNRIITVGGQINWGDSVPTVQMVKTKDTKHTHDELQQEIESMADAIGLAWYFGPGTKISGVQFN